MKNQATVELFTKLTKFEKDIYNKVWAEYSAHLKKGVIPEKNSSPQRLFCTACESTNSLLFTGVTVTFAQNSNA